VILDAKYCEFRGRKLSSPVVIERQVLLWVSAFDTDSEWARGVEAIAGAYPLSLSHPQPAALDRERFAYHD
jgi:hypothetical protein